MKKITTVGMNPAEKLKLMGNVLGSFGNENIRADHIEYFEGKIRSESEESKGDIVSTPNYYAWLCLMTEHVFWMMRHFCFRQADLAGDGLIIEYNRLVTEFCDKCRDLRIFSGSELGRLYDLVVKVLYIRHAIIHRGFPNLLPVGFESRHKRKKPAFSKDQIPRSKFEEEEARKIISWYSKPTNFEQIKKEFREIINATKKGPSISVGF